MVFNRWTTEHNQNESNICNEVTIIEKLETNSKQKFFYVFGTKMEKSQVKTFFFLFFRDHQIFATEIKFC